MEVGALIADIEQVLPHRGRMRLVERVLEWDTESIAVGLRVPLDGLFQEDGGMPAHAGIEYMAQAVACWAGCQARLRGNPPPLGFLLGSRRYESAVPVFPAGAELRIEARRELLGENGLGVFACRILEAGVVIATANVSVFEPPDERAYVESVT